MSLRSEPSEERAAIAPGATPAGSDAIAPEAAAAGVAGLLLLLLLLEYSYSYSFSYSG